MDFALGMAEPPAVQNGSLFSSANVLRCLSDLSESAEENYKLFQMFFQHIFLTRIWKRMRPSKPESLFCLNTALPSDSDHRLHGGALKVAVVPVV